MLKENIVIIQKTYTIYVYMCVFIFVYNVNSNIFHKVYKIIYAEV